MQNLTELTGLNVNSEIFFRTCIKGLDTGSEEIRSNMNWEVEAIGVGVSQAINFEPSTEGSDSLSSLVDVTDLGETEKSGGVSGNECRMLAPSPCLSEESLNFSPLFSLIFRLVVYVLNY